MRKVVSAPRDLYGGLCSERAADHINALMPDALFETELTMAQHKKTNPRIESRKDEGQLLPFPIQCGIDSR